MSNLWLKIWIWIKIAVSALLAIYVLTFIAKNSGYTAKFWYWFGRDSDVLVLYLASFSFVGGVVVTLLVRTTFKTLRQIRDVRQRSRADRLEREVADMRTKAAMLQTRSAPPSESASDDTATP
jgi:uncharacterized integral membrane protein